MKNYPGSKEWKQEKYNNILEVGFRMFAEKGIEQVTMTELAEASEVGRSEKGTATIRSATYNSETKKATFNAYLTVPENAVIVKAGLVASPATSFNHTNEVLTSENARFVKSLAEAEGKSAPVNYTWNLKNVEAGTTIYARAYLVYTLNGAEHTVYGSLVTFTATNNA